MSDNQIPEPTIKLIPVAALLADGRSREQVRTLVRHGVLVSIGRGLYVKRPVAREFKALPNGDHMLRAAAAVAHKGPSCAVSHRSAALLHNIDLVGGPLADVTITTWAGGRRGRRHGVHTYACTLPAAHTRQFGIPVTTAARTVVDLARSLPFAEGVVAADSALRQGLTTAVELWQVAGQCRLQRGGDQADRVVHFADGRAESPLESLARVVFDEGGLPPPELQVTITGADNQLIGRVDFLWRKYRTIVEVDGAAKYEQDPHRARTELWRDKAFQRAGYQVLHFNWREITAEADQTTAVVWAELRARGADPAS